MNKVKINLFLLGSSATAEAIAIKAGLPINKVLAELDELIKTGEIERGYKGQYRIKAAFKL